MNEGELKIRFARLNLKLNDSFLAALEVFPNANNIALRASHEWPTDPDVIAATADIIAEEGDLSLPTKNDLIKQAWKVLEDSAKYPDIYAKLLKPYAEIRGFVEKPQTNIQNNIQNNLGTLTEEEKEAALARVTSGLEEFADYD